MQLQLKVKLSQMTQKWLECSERRSKSPMSNKMSISLKNSNSTKTLLTNP